MRQREKQAGKLGRPAKSTGTGRFQREPGCHGRGVRCRSVAEAVLVVLLLAVSILVSGAGVFARAVERAELYGFAPAYPEEELTAVVSEKNQPFTRHKRVVRMVLEVDKGGKVVGAEAADSSQYRYAEWLDGYVKGVRFVPAEFEGKKVGSRVPVDFVFDPRRAAVEVLPAVDHRGKVVEQGRYFDVFPLNELYPPRIVEFPSLFVELHWRDTASVYPYVLLALGLDTMGRVTEVEVVRSTIPSFTQTTVSASLWAEYEPLVVKEERRASECFVLVSYYPQVIYPTKVWRAEEVDRAPILERERVRLLPDTVGVMARPVPRTPGGDSVAVSGVKVYSDRDTSGAIFAIDTSGRLGVQAFDLVSRELTKALRNMSGGMAFYPALDYAGRPKSYRRWVYLTGLPSGKLRIEYVW